MSFLFFYFVGTFIELQITFVCTSFCNIYDVIYQCKHVKYKQKTDAVLLRY